MPIRMFNRLHKFCTSESGVAAIEFSFVVTILLTLLLVVTDFGLAAYRKMQVQNAAQAGVQYAMIKGFSSSAMISAIQNATTFSGISATPAPTQFCGCPTNTGVENAACGAPCSGGGTAGRYVTASAAGTHNTFLTYLMLPSSFNFTSQSTVRVQ